MEYLLHFLTLVFTDSTFTCLLFQHTVNKSERLKLSNDFYYFFFAIRCSQSWFFVIFLNNISNIHIKFPQNRRIKHTSIAANKGFCMIIGHSLLHFINVLRHHLTYRWQWKLDINRRILLSYHLITTTTIYPTVL